MKRVLVVGSPGAGKSTFARRLRDRTGLPLHYLDQLFWRADHTHIEPDDFDAKIRAIVETDSWIMDGNYLRTMPMRMDACDTVFFLDYPLEVCQGGVKSRVGHPHEDLPWTESSLDEVFYQYVTDFRTEQLPGIRRIIAEHPEPQLIVFHSREESAAYLDSLN